MAPSYGSVVGRSTAAADAGGPCRPAPSPLRLRHAVQWKVLDRQGVRRCQTDGAGKSLIQGGFCRGGEMAGTHPARGPCSRPARGGRRGRPTPGPWSKRQARLVPRRGAQFAAASCNPPCVHQHSLRQARADDEGGCRQHDFESFIAMLLSRVSSSGGRSTSVRGRACAPLRRARRRPAGHPRFDAAPGCKTVREDATLSDVNSLIRQCANPRTRSRPLCSGGRLRPDPDAPGRSSPESRTASQHRLDLSEAQYRFGPDQILIVEPG